MNKKVRKLNILLLTALAALALSVPVAFAQNGGGPSVQSRSVTAGQRMKLKGTVVSRDADTIVVRNELGIDTPVAISGASIRTKGGFWGTGRTIPANALVRGLYVEVEGTGGSDGRLMASRVRFEKDDLRVSQS